MIEDKQFQNRFNEYKQKCQIVSNYSGLIKQLLQSPHPDSWLILDYILLTVQGKDIRHFNELRYQIERGVRIIRSFPMLIFVYSLKVNRKDYRFSSINWMVEFQQVAISLGELAIFSSWIYSKLNLKEVQETLWLVIRVFPIMVKNQYIKFGEQELGYIIEWVAYFDTPDPDKYADVCQLIKSAKETEIRDSITQRQHVLLKKLMEVACQTKNTSSNIFLFIYPMLLAEKEISSFCEINYEFITEIGEGELLNFFISLTRGAISKEALVLIQKISQLLANQEQYFKMRFLYQSFILPVLVKRAKACSRVDEAVFQTSSLYILGLLKHCDIGLQGVQCITKNIGKIKNQRVIQKWVQLCALIGFQYPELKNQLTKQLRKQLNRVVQLNNFGNFAQQLSDPNCVWDISLRSGRKHKKYSKVPSKLRGISNRGNQCYIISVVQGLQRCELFPNLLDKHRQQIKGRYKLLDEVRILFSQLSGKRKADNIGVNYLKKLSPQEFVKSHHQEDAYEYLIKLIDLMQGEMKNVPGMLQEFKSIYQIDQVSTIFCQKCKYSTDRPDKFYIYTIPYTAVLSEQTVQPLSDFSCQNCKSPPGTCVLKRKIFPKCQTLIIHINRFSHSQGQVFKQLSTQRILRTFFNYELVGMICHRGKKIERGHYLYFHKLSQKKWAQFNDRCVDQFELEQPYEEFERQWKSQMTPFILFYQLSNRPK